MYFWKPIEEIIILKCKWSWSDNKKESYDKKELWWTKTINFVTIYTFVIKASLVVVFDINILADITLMEKIPKNILKVKNWQHSLWTIELNVLWRCAWSHNSGIPIPQGLFHVTLTWQRTTCIFQWSLEREFMYFAGKLVSLFVLASNQLAVIP